jgi:bifunctional DNA-binding transcriptional regulator/antitoxin component of YhaV-PrlF toxin-antitoxin module
MEGFLRKVYSKKGSNSLIFNIPIQYAKSKGIKKGDYLTIIETEDSIIIKKTEFKKVG